MSDSSNISLDYKCPQKWGSMTPKGNGRYCGECKKVVTDFSNHSLEQLNQIDISNLEERPCGSFLAYQLNNPFNNRKDRIIAFYQRKSLNSNGNKIYKRLTLFFVMAVMVITGCAKRYSTPGFYSPGKDGRKLKNKKEVSDKEKNNNQ